MVIYINQNYEDYIAFKSVFCRIHYLIFFSRKILEDEVCKTIAFRFNVHEVQSMIFHIFDIPQFSGLWLQFLHFALDSLLH